MKLHIAQCSIYNVFTDSFDSQIIGVYDSKDKANKAVSGVDDSFIRTVDLNKAV